MGHRKVTIKDIARKSGVSIATVSRVLNLPEYPVNAKTKQKVLDAVAELDYSPNFIGKSLKTEVSKEIGIIIPNITNTYFPHIILNINNILQKYGYDIILYNSFRRMDREIKNLQNLRSKRVAGVILDSVNGTEKILNSIIEDGVKVVLLEKNEELHCDTVIYDFHQAGYMAAKHLIDLGHRDIAFLGAPLIKVSRKDKFNGFIKCLKDHNITPNEKFVLIAENEDDDTEIFEYQNGKNLFKKLMQQPDLPTALFAINDLTAIGAMQQAAQMGLNIPYDISIIGFDNTALSEAVYPPLTTIDQKTAEIGTIAARLLLNSINNIKSEPVILEPEMILRKSTTHPKTV